jgi:PIN domain
VIMNPVPMAWESTAVTLVNNLAVSAVLNSGSVYPRAAVLQILNGVPGSTYVRHALLDLLTQSGAWYLLESETGALDGPAYRPLVLEQIIEDYARNEGSRTVGERHVTALFREAWSAQLAEIGIDAEALDEHVRNMELGPVAFREVVASCWHGLLDANILIQGKDIDHIHWDKETSQKRVLLWISSTLLDELDRIKFGHQSKRVRKRVTHFGRWIAPQMESAVNGPGILIRSGVALRVWTAGRATDGHDTDHLISALNMRDHGIPVVMVTQDLGLQARSIAAGVPVLALSEESMLPPEQQDANAEG